MKKRNNAIGSYDQYRSQQVPNEDDEFTAAQEKRIREFEDKLDRRLITKEKLIILGGLAITGLAFIAGMWLGKERGVED